MKRCAAFTLFLIVAITRADDLDTWFAASPDKKLFAVERRIPSSDEPSRLDLDGFAVFICTAEDGIQRTVIAQHSFSGRVVSEIRWSPDSQFLLFTTASSGGHSPWHFKTFAFCAADKSFRDVETASGAPVGAAEFQFEPPDIALLKLHQPASDTLKQIKLPLGKSMKQMERLQ
jgi:dipeptidyl aminopeptidase/acylaminoacyl peptidase